MAGYEILRLLGRGGMGVVYEAVQVGLNRRVALKMIRHAGSAGTDEHERFEREAQALAALRHDGIVQVFDVGSLDGCPYFSLELIPGGSLHERLGGTPLPAGAAATLVEKLARATHVAHTAGIIHRDLKPANVLLVEDPATPPEQWTPKITDFGLALMGTGHTITGAVLGTPSYMAPEQARGESHQSGPAADVYALGAILYECLTGRPPFKAATPLETIRQVQTDDPVAPRTLQPGTPRDLETICLKCLQKEPRKRYDSAAALAEDLRRFRQGEPIAARPAGVAERAWKWVRRRPAIAALLGVVVLFLATLVGGGIAFVVQLDAAWRLAVEEQGKANEREQEALWQKSRAEREEQAARDQLALSRLNSMTAHLRQVGGVYERDPASGQSLLHDYGFCPLDLHDTAWRFYAQQCQRQHAVLQSSPARVHALSFSRDGKVLVAGECRLCVWDPTTYRLVRAFEGEKRELLHLVLLPDGETAISGDDAGTVRRWSIKTGKSERIHEQRNSRVSALAVTPDGKQLAVARGSPVLILDPATGKELARFPEVRSGVLCLAFHPDGKLLAGAGLDGTVHLWNVEKHETVALLKGHRRTVLGVAFSPDGGTLASAAQDVVKVWDVERRRCLFDLQAREGNATYGGHGIAFSPDGSQLAIANGFRRVVIWDAHRGVELARLRAPSNGVDVVAWHPAGALLASAGNDGCVRLWRASLEPARIVIEGGLRTDHLVYGGNGRWLAGSGGGTVTVWNPKTGEELSTFQASSNNVGGLAAQRNGSLLAVSHSSVVDLWDIGERRRVGQLRGHEPTAWRVVFSPDDRVLAVACEKHVKLWQVAEARLLGTLPEQTATVLALAFSPDGRTLATTTGKAILLWDLASREVRLRLEDPAGSTELLAFSPDGKLLATASGRLGLPGDIRLWDPATGRPLVVARGHLGPVYALAFTPDSQTMVSGSLDQTVRFWEVVSGLERVVIQGNGAVTHATRFSPDGQTLALGDNAGKVRLVDVGGDPCVAVWPQLGHHVESVAFSAGGELLATSWDRASPGENVAVFETKTGRAAGGPTGGAGRVGQLAFSPDGAILAGIIVEKTRGDAIQLWDAKTRKPLRLLRRPQHPFLYLAFSPDGKLLASCGGGRSGPGEVLLWDPAKGELLATLSDRTSKALGFTSDGATLAVVEDCKLLLWDVAARRRRAALPIAGDWVYALALHPNRLLAATSGSDQVVRLWSLEPGQERELAALPHEGVGALAFSSNGDWLAVADARTDSLGGVTLWDMATRTAGPRYNRHDGSVRCLAFHPQQPLLATGSADQSVRLWRVPARARAD
jgi:WD40 repeat protein